MNIRCLKKEIILNRLSLKALKTASKEHTNAKTNVPNIRVMLCNVCGGLEIHGK